MSFFGGSKNHFGLDIGSTSVKLVQVAKSGDKYTLVTLGQLPIGKVDISQKEVDISPLTATIKQLVKDCKVNTNSVAVALPEAQVYTRVIDFPVMSTEELGQALKYQIEQYVPLPAEEVSVKHTIVGQQTGTNPNMKVLIVATPNYLVDRYAQIVEKSGLELVAIDTETLCAARALVGISKDSPTTLLIDVGSLSTDVALVKHGEIISTRSVGTGGQAITRAISSELGVEEKQANEYRNTYGMNPNQLNGSVHKAMTPVLDLIISEVKRVLLTVQNANQDDTPKRVIMSGGAALIPGLVVYFAVQLSVEIELGNPFANVAKTPAQTTAIGEAGVVFTNAVGLAMKEV